jgi:conjugal transfer pilus assembly protein TraW
MRSGNASLLALFVLAVADPAAHAGDDALRALRDQRSAIDQAVGDARAPAWLTPDLASTAHAAGAAVGAAAHDRLRAGADQSVVEACRDLGQLCGAPSTASVGEPLPVTATPITGSAEKVSITVLVSSSLGDAQLKDIFALAAGRPDVRVAFRGVAQDESLKDFVRRVHALLAGLEPPPDVVIDPKPFRETSAEVVPLLIASGPDGEVARVAGLADPAWLRAQVLGGARGDLGVRAPVRAVAEPDMIAEIHRRLAALNLHELRDRALGRFWQRAALETLPVATAWRERTVDPTLVAAAAANAPDGTVLIPAGATTNPLDHLPFTRRLVVFDASDPRQVTLARSLGNRDDGRRVVYLATRSERSSAWDGWTAVEDALDAPVYLLTPDVRARFAIERVPSLVEARDRVFVVTELPPPGSG